MINIAFDFTWQRPADVNGFGWDAAGAVDDMERRLVRIDGGPFTNYQPLTEGTGLFRTFADLEATPTAVLDFVNRYGHPSYRAGHSAATGKAALLPFDAGAIFDNLSGWKEMIRRMKSLVAVWDALCQTD